MFSYKINSLKLVETKILASLAFQWVTIELIFIKIDLNHYDSIEIDNFPFHEKLMNLLDVFL